MNITDLTK